MRAFGSASKLLLTAPEKIWKDDDIPAVPSTAPQSSMCLVAVLSRAASAISLGAERSFALAGWVRSPMASFYKTPSREFGARRASYGEGLARLGCRSLVPIPRDINTRDLVGAIVRPARPRR